MCWSQVDQDGLNRQIVEKKFIREQELEKERCFQEEEKRRAEVLNKKHEELAKVIEFLRTTPILDTIVGFYIRVGAPSNPIRNQ